MTFPELDTATGAGSEMYVRFLPPPRNSKRISAVLPTDSIARRQSKAVRGTDIACVVFSGGGRLITPNELDDLHSCQLYAEQNFVYNQPPKLVILPNMTHNRTEVVLLDLLLKGDSKVPFVELIRQQIHDSLQPNTRLSGSMVMWEGIDEDLRPDMLAKARESLEIIPFYPRPVKLLTRQDYDSVRLLCAVVEQQKAQKLANMCSVGMWLARTWLFHAWSAVAKAKKRSKGQPAPKHHNDEFIKQLGELSKSFNQQYIRGSFPLLRRSVCACACGRSCRKLSDLLGRLDHENTAG